MAIRLDENSKSSSNSTRHAFSPRLVNFQLPLIFLNGPETSVMDISLNGVATFRVVNDLRMPLSEKFERSRISVLMYFVYSAAFAILDEVWIGCYISHQRIHVFRGICRND